MSALDQRMAEARENVLKTVRAERHCTFHSPGQSCALCEGEAQSSLDALLTTHRRQVLTEVVEGLQKEIAAFGETFPGYTGSDLERGKLYAIRFVASLRDTKENDR